MLYNFLVSQPNFWNLLNLPIIYVGTIFWIFFKFRFFFCSAGTFFTTSCYFLYMFSVGIMNISQITLIVFQLIFCNNTFPLNTVVIKILNFNDRPEISWRPLKRYVTLASNVFWKILCSATFVQSFIARVQMVQGLSRKVEGSFRPLSYLISKKYGLVRVEACLYVLDIIERYIRGNIR